MRSRRRSAGLMPFQMRSTRQISKRVRPFMLHMQPCSNSRSNAELEALGMDDEEEGTSYLADLNKAPDFLDEAPVEVTEVRISNSLPILPVLTLCVVHSHLMKPQKPSGPLISTLPPFLPI